MDPWPLKSDEVLTLCALRFDGYRYLEDTGFDAEAAIDAYMETEMWDRCDEEKLCVFFILQRCLCKWSLVYEPPNGRYWRVFRQMFFEVVELEVPEKYAEPNWMADWVEHYEWRRAKAISSVRRSHSAYKYDDNAPYDF